MQKKLVELIRAVKLIGRKQGATIKELEETLCICRRSVYRRLKIIEELGLPIYDEKVDGERKKRWKFTQESHKLSSNNFIPMAQFTLPQILALYMIKAEARFYTDTEIGKQLDSAYKMIESLALPEFCDRIPAIRSLFLSTKSLTKDYSDKEEFINKLTEAMLKKKTCKTEYHSFKDNKIKSIEIDPLHFIEHSGGLYILVRKTENKDIRILAVERIQSLEITDNTFIPPSDHVAEALNEAFGIVWDDPVHARIRIAPNQARYILERKFGGTTNYEEQPDGSLIMDIKTSGRYELKSWILSQGERAHVLEPKELRKEIQTEIQNMCAAYNKPPQVETDSV